MSCENVTMLKLAIACPLEVGLSAMVLALDSVLQKSGFAKKGVLRVWWVHSRGLYALRKAFILSKVLKDTLEPLQE